MDRLDREILKAILTEKQSIYNIRKNIKGSNYATIWRHIKKMKKDGLLIVEQARRKNGKHDKRKTKLLKLTNKGIATLLIEGDLQKEELFSVGRKIFQIYFGKKLPQKTEPFMTDIFAVSLLELKPKVNLDRFDEEWFRDIFRYTHRKAVIKAVKKYRAKFEKEGIWATEKELQEHDLIGKAIRDLINKKILKRE